MTVLRTKEKLLAVLREERDHFQYYACEVSSGWFTVFRTTQGVWFESWLAQSNVWGPFVYSESEISDMGAYPISRRIVPANVLVQKISEAQNAIIT